MLDPASNLEPWLFSAQVARGVALVRADHLREGPAPVLPARVPRVPHDAAGQDTLPGLAWTLLQESLPRSGLGATCWPWANTGSWATFGRFQI